MTDSKEWCDGDWRCRSSLKPFAGAESGSPGRALEAGKRGSPGRAVQAGIRGKRLNMQKNSATYNLLPTRRSNWRYFALQIILKLIKLEKFIQKEVQSLTANLREP